MKPNSTLNPDRTHVYRFSIIHYKVKSDDYQKGKTVLIVQQDLISIQ